MLWRPEGAWREGPFIFRNGFSENRGWISLRTFCMNIPFSPYLVIDMAIQGE